MKHPYANALLDRVKDGESVPADQINLALAQTGDALTRLAEQQRLLDERAREIGLSCAELGVCQDKKPPCPTCPALDKPITRPL